MRPLRTKTKVLADEYTTESPLLMDQEMKLENLRFLNKNKNILRLPYPKPTQVRR